MPGRDEIKEGIITTPVAADEFAPNNPKVDNFGQPTRYNTPPHHPSDIDPLAGWTPGFNADDYNQRTPKVEVMEGGVNLSPKGVNIGFPTQQKAVGQAEGEGFDEMTKEFIQMHRIGSKMEDDTENALNMMEKMREDTVRKAEK